MSEATTTATFNATYLSGLFQSVADRGRALVGFPRAEEHGPPALLGLTLRLLAGRGEASNAALAQMILAGYERLAQPEKRAFLIAVAERYGYDQALLGEAARAFLAEPGEATAARLAAQTQPRRRELLRRLNHAPGGTLALVGMRRDLLGFVREHPALAAFDQDFVSLFSSWFNRGFLVLRRIDWTTPANILEKIIRYEAVHTMHGFEDLRRRLEPRDRRLYAFFHPALGDEPLIFVEVALTDAIPAAIGPLLEPERTELAPQAATTAVFYSISNAQRGLAHVSFGNFLIKQVVEDLKRELPRLQNFVTLSPAPGFAAWLAAERERDHSPYLTPPARRALGLLDHPNWITKPAAAAAVAK
ncbi:MAG: malonyl-CoA decarboxylase family protein, partial [Hyphomicrobiales bacterium]|nr:malonyl-CoA decarboxylase family protein [Hyphomicrobiales bacterium]